MSIHRLKTVNVKCSLCHLRNICLPTRLLESEFTQLDHIIKKRIVLNRGESLINNGEKFNALYAVSSGSFKSQVVSYDGFQQITNFFLPGELVGLSSIGRERHNTQVIALETSSVCRINFSELEDVLNVLPNLHKEVLALMSKEIRQEQLAIKTISQQQAKQRISSFLLNLSDRNRKNGILENFVTLSMTRTDIADYLGLAKETVSRQLSKLAEKSLIEVEGRTIFIKDRASLVELVQSNE